MRKTTGVRASQVDSTKYHWTRVEGLRGLLELTADASVVRQVTLRNAEKARDWSFYSGDSYNYVEEAFIFSNGAIIASVSVTGFAGTFASHHDSKVLYFHLTKRSAKE